MDDRTMMFLRHISHLENVLIIQGVGILALIVVIVFLVLTQASRPAAASPPAEEKPVTLVETDATREECVKKLNTMFAFFPGTQSMLVQYDNSTYRQPGSVLFMVFEANPFFGTWKIDIKGPVSKTDSFAGIAHKNDTAAFKAGGCMDSSVVVDPDFFKDERNATVDASWSKRYIVVSLVRGFKGEDVARELRRMVGESAGVVQ